MKLGDLVRLKDDWHHYGLGIVTYVESNYCWVLFLHATTPSFNGKKWCHNPKLEVVSG